jgi:hypothetical protein
MEAADCGDRLSDVALRMPQMIFKNFSSAKKQASE